MSQSVGGWEKEWRFYQDWKGRNQFYGNCLVISLLKPELEHVDTKYIEKIFSFRERKPIAIKRQSFQLTARTPLSFLRMNKIPSHQIIQQVNKNKFSWNCTSFKSSKLAAVSSICPWWFPGIMDPSVRLVLLQATWVPGGPQGGHSFSNCLPEWPGLSLLPHHDG